MTGKSISLSLFLVFCTSIASAALEYVERDYVASKTYRRRGKVRYDFGPERLGYVTLDGQPVLGDAAHPVPVTNVFLSARVTVEEGRLTFYRAKCPDARLGELKFECSNGRVLEFWDDAYRISENLAIAKSLGDGELAARYQDQLKAKGISSLADVIRRCVAHTNLTMVSCQIPTKDGELRRVERINLPNLVKDTFPAPATAYDLTRYQQERLGRGFCVFRGHADRKLCVCSWRSLPSDPTNLAFDVYLNGRKMNAAPLTAATHFTVPARRGGEWELVSSTGERARPVVATDDATHFRIPLADLPDGVTPDGESYTYVPEEAGVGDLDGDGEYELVLKRSPSIAKDNSQDGYTGETMLEAYRLDGRFLWRIALGVNIRSGSHYTQLLVYDLDGDGKAEVCCKTADGTTDGRGRVIGDAKADYRGKGGRPPRRKRRAPVPDEDENEDEELVDIKGRILSGPEYLTVFRGTDGAVLDTIPFEPARGDIEDWGDSYGNRCDRFLAAICHFDGARPSFIVSRGYYAMTKIAAYDFRNGKIVRRWFFDSSQPGNGDFAGQGFHNLHIGDIDFDGKDEIVFGSMVVDHDGRGVYSTHLGHGDNQHLIQSRPDMRGLQAFTCHESKGHGVVLRDAATGRKLWQHRYPFDAGMCVTADFDPTNYGYEFWMGRGYPVWDVSGKILPGVDPTGWQRYLIWWKGDLLRSIACGGSHINHYDWERKTWTLEKLPYPKVPKRTPTRKQKKPVFAGDILGDWREELVIAAPGDRALMVFSSPHPTAYRFHTFMLDPVYRLSVATWPIAYNQSTQAGFYFGPDLLGHGIWFRGTYLKSSIRPSQ